jgi:hypothetical protein
LSCFSTVFSGSAKAIARADVEFTQSGEADSAHYSTVDSREQAAIEDIDLHPPSCIPKNGGSYRSRESAAFMASSIAIAKTDQDLLQIGRLRYELFVERDGKSYRDVDKDQRLLLEPVDKRSLNFFGTIGSDCVVAVRSTRVQDAGCDERLSRIVEQSVLPPDQTSTTVIYSRFVVCDRIRARLLIPELFRDVYRAALSSGMTHSILAARPSLIPIFERFGFLAAPTAFFDEIAGPMVIMKLDLLDRDHKARTGSPLFPDYDDFVSRRSTHRNSS